MIDREIVENFFWRNFELNFSILSGIDSIKSKINVKENLFIKIDSMPNYQIVDFEGSKLPLFTQSGFIKKVDYTIDNEGFIIFNFDIFGNIFYLLSGILELNTPKDELRRSNFKNSIFSDTDLHFVPAVDYYFHFIEAILLENNYAIKPKFEKSILVSHDVDNLQNLYRKKLKKSILSFDFLGLFKTIFSFFTKKYLVNTFNEIKYLQKKYNFKSSYFILPDNSKYFNYQNADYKIDNKNIFNVLESISDENQIEIHAGFETSINPEKFKNQKQLLASKFNKSISVNRFHYLMFDRLQTPQVLSKAGIEIDSTLGFNDMFGFRNFSCKPYYLFDFQSFNTTNVVELPLILMDATFFYKHYLHLESAQNAFELIEKVLFNIENVGGILCINWHNDAFDDSEKREWVVFLEMILNWSVKHNFKSIDYNDIAKIIKNE